MKLFAIFGILLMLGGAVAYVDRNAVARVEGQRLVDAHKARARNEATAREVAEAKAEKRAARATALEERLASLPPAPEPLGEFCRPGCTLRWSGE